MKAKGDVLAGEHGGMSKKSKELVERILENGKDEEGDLDTRLLRTAICEERLKCGDLTKKTIPFGRRIDLLIENSGIELSASEWKTNKATSNTSITRQVENIRANKAILNYLRKLTVESSRFNELINISMYWMVPVEDAYVAVHMYDLMVPEFIGEIPKFTNILDKLLWWKKHHLKLMRIVQLAHAELTRTQKLSKAREGSGMKRMNSPATFFTPVTKRTKTNPIERVVVQHEDQEDKKEEEEEE
ncbi:hypothetical protein BDC45DRAFT_537426 [Circinella umbellata]|nr:hypothetical protein BDC45DRAFT_537426 [Circinella umbellata]